MSRKHFFGSKCHFCVETIIFVTARQILCLLWPIKSRTNFLLWTKILCGNDFCRLFKICAYSHRYWVENIFCLKRQFCVETIIHVASPKTPDTESKTCLEMQFFVHDSPKIYFCLDKWHFCPKTLFNSILMIIDTKSLDKRQESFRHKIVV